MSNTGYYQNPGLRQEISNGPGDTRGFFVPNDSKLMGSPQQLLAYLTNNGSGLTAGQETNRTVKYDGGLTREMMGNGFGSLSGQIGGLQDMFKGGFGGLGTGVYDPTGVGGSFSNINSPVYRAGQVGGNKPANGYGGMFASNGPFSSTF